ncbi:hypothetical protein BHE74_00051876, partial [Ensete ventricosum]
AEVRSIFRAPSRKFKILHILNALAHGKSYEHGFMKIHDSHKFCAKLRFGYLRNSKYYPFLMY